MKINVKKLAVSAMLAAVAVSMSGFVIPIGASKCFPIQHLCNVIAGVFLGPWYGVAMAFTTSLIRNLIGTGSLLAFPGSMVGAYLCGVLYQKSGKLAAAYFGEVFGTGIFRRNPLLSGCRTVNGKRGGVIYVCHAIFYEYHVWYGHCRRAHWHYGKVRGIFLFESLISS